MPPFIALCLCVLFVGWMLYREVRDRRSVSKALWIPTIWLLIRGSRPLSVWFQMGGTGGNLEGNPVDATFELVLILAAISVLVARGMNFKSFAASNRAVVCLYLFLGLSVLWSDYSFVAFKRWFKDFGSVFILLVVLTEMDPQEAIRALYTRVAYVLIPFSVLLIRYYPALGRSYNRGGVQWSIGVADQKNSLGQIVMITGLFLLWDYLQTLTNQTGRGRRKVPWRLLVILVMGAWLLHVSQSKTSLLCLGIGVALFASKRLSSEGTGKVVLLGALSMPFILFFTQLFAPLVAPIVQLVGRDLTFTGRTNVWGLILTRPINPLFGTGFYSFWERADAKAVENELGGIHVAHNGFLELYLDGGLVGVCLLCVALLTVGIHLTKRTEMETYRKMRFALLITVIIADLSESFFFRGGLAWFAMLFALIEVKRTRLQPQRRMGVTQQTPTVSVS
jgi:exopolysaccharide production protein ExoQ